MTPVLIDTEKLIPYVDKTKHTTECSVCKKPQAKWDLLDITEEDPEAGTPEASPSAETEVLALPVCSLCFLYQSNWADSHTESLTGLVDEVEKTKGSELVPFRYERDLMGRLTKIEDADGILLSIALISRRLYMQTRASGAQG